MYQKYFDKFNEIAKISTASNSVSRAAFSSEDYELRKYIIKLLKKNNLEVFVDEIGNIFGCTAQNKTKKTIMLGTHIDTGSEDGKYSGIVGVLAGLAAIEFLTKKKVGENIVLAVFVGKEYFKDNDFVGARFFAGDNAMLEVVETNEDYAKFLNYEKILLKNNFFLEIDYFLEVIMEDGNNLILANKQIGIVNYLTSATICSVFIEGETSSSANIGVEKRHDALVSAALVINEINDIALARCEEGVLATVTNINVLPGAYNKVPARVELSLEVRGKNNEDIVTCLQEIKDAISTITEVQDVTISLKVKIAETIVAMSAELNDKIIHSCQECKLSIENLGYAFDQLGLIIGKAKAGAVIVLPNKGGITHNKAEKLELQDFNNGVAVLEHLISHKILQS